MKNDQQENGLLRGPLIFIVPASNLIAVLSLDWLDGTNRAAVSAETRGWNYLATRPTTPKEFAGRDVHAHRGRRLGHLATAKAWRTRIWTVPKLNPILYKLFSP